MSIDIADLRAKLAAATPGPWERRLHDGVRDSRSRLIKVIAPSDEYSFERAVSLADYLDGDNAELIVAAVNSLPALLDELERLRDAESRAVTAEMNLREMTIRADRFRSALEATRSE